MQQATAYRAAVEAGGLRTFVKLYWPYAEPGIPYRDTWHIGALCEFVQAWHMGEFRRGVIGIPPGTGKSLIVDVFAPAWIWARDPARRWLGCSFDQSLLHRDAGKSLAIIQSPVYMHAYPRTRIRGGAPALGNLYTTLAGNRTSTSPGAGGGMGRHYHDVSVNDPIKPKDAQRGGADVVAAYRLVESWWDGTMPTRRMPGFGWLLTMQRLAEGDLSGRELGKGECEHLCLPMHYEPRAYWVYPGKQQWTERLEQRTVPGELLCPELKTAEDVAEMTRDLGDHAPAQLEQNPTPRSGGLVVESHLRLEWVEPPVRGLRIQVWDFAAKGTQDTHSAVNGQLWECAVHVGKVRELLNKIAERDQAPNVEPPWLALELAKASRYYLLDEVWGIMTVPVSEAVFAAVQQLPEWARAHQRVIEEKASGIGVLQRYARAYPGVVAFHEVSEECAQLAKENKVDRLRPALPDLAGDLVLLPRTFSTKAIAGVERTTPDMYRKELIGFPRAAKDDRVDCTSMALAVLSKHTHAYWDAVRALAAKTDGGLARLQARARRR